mgnify:CR=1 FL=1
MAQHPCHAHPQRVQLKDGTPRLFRTYAKVTKSHTSQIHRTLSCGANALTGKGFLEREATLMSHQLAAQNYDGAASWPIKATCKLVRNVSARDVPWLCIGGIDALASVSRDCLDDMSATPELWECPGDIGATTELALSIATSCTQNFESNRTSHSPPL